VSIFRRLPTSPTQHPRPPGPARHLPSTAGAASRATECDGTISVIADRFREASLSIRRTRGRKVRWLDLVHRPAFRAAATTRAISPNRNCDERSTASTARAGEMTVVEGGGCPTNGLCFRRTNRRCIWSSRDYAAQRYAYDVAGGRRYPTSASHRRWTGTALTGCAATLTAILDGLGDGRRDAGRRKHLQRRMATDRAASTCRALCNLCFGAPTQPPVHGAAKSVYALYVITQGARRKAESIRPLFLMICRKQDLSPPFRYFFGEDMLLDVRTYYLPPRNHQEDISRSTRKWARHRRPVTSGNLRLSRDETGNVTSTSTSGPMRTPRTAHAAVPR